MYFLLYSFCIKPMKRVVVEFQPNLLLLVEVSVCFEFGLLKAIMPIFIVDLMKHGCSHSNLLKKHPYNLLWIGGYFSSLV